ncbi:Hypothetical predicted protein [Paramuricea clavata]|uniref:Uncharacterized protein n=1 Tax=Paramuricea clavata TaxID=317549 RepID=A0A7D9IZV7_PARCT|nr:Hypothetical predicted protein [Paramuricea clavata]
MLPEVSPKSYRSLTEVSPKPHQSLPKVSPKPHQSLPKVSFAFEGAIGNSYGPEKVGLTARDQGPLLLELEDCLSYGVSKSNKFGRISYSISLALRDKEEFVSAQKLVEKESADHVGNPGENIMKCLYRKGSTPTLYVNIDDETEIYPPKGDEPVDHKKYQDKRFRLEAIIKIESNYVSSDVTSIQVKLHEANILEEKPKAPRKRLLRRRD